MPKGGARNRSGPQKDLGSLRSANIVVTALPSEGYDGEPPAFPLMRRTVHRWEFEDKRRFQVRDEETTAEVAERESELWAWAWRTPQACAWALEPWRWQTVAMWVRTFVICEGNEATAADKGAVHRFADQIGLTPAGLKENGWAIAKDQVGEKRDEKKSAPAKRTTARDRMKVVSGGDGG
ncbi:MAG TPA: hypothetical protein VFK41_03020 [Nocardioidaceae bacterium]|nr:hypothetical protein [Nocardioidaceae bacterium]